jgi:hypothetical protein
MPLTPKTTRHFYRTLYSGEMQKIRFLKRGDNQQAGTVTAYILFNCRAGDIIRTGEIIDGNMSSGDRTYWVIPVQELKRVGLSYVSPADRIEDLKTGRVWEPEAPQNIDLKTFDNYFKIYVVRLK